MPAGDPPYPLDAETRLVIRQLRETAARCMKLMLNPPGKTDKQQNFNASRAAQMLNGLNRDLDAIGGRLARVSIKKVRGAYTAGVRYAEQLARDSNVAVPGSAFAGNFSAVDRRRAMVLAQQTAGDLNKAVKSIKETTGKVVRQTHALNLDPAAVNKLLGGGTLEGAPKKVLRDLKKLVRTAAIDGKIVTVTSKGGARHFKPDFYAEMVFQTKLAETTNIATIQRLQEKQLFYVKIIGSNSRNFCTAFVGRVFYTGPGEDPLGLFPNIRSLPRGGAPFHPRCTKRYVAFIPRSATPAEIEAAKLKPNERELLSKSGTEAQKLFAEQRKKATAPAVGAEQAATVQAEAKDARRKLREIDQGTNEEERQLVVRRQAVSERLTEALDAADFDRADELAGDAKSLIDQIAAVQARRRESGLAVLRADRPAPISSLLDGALGPARKSIAEKGIEEMSKLVDQSLLPRIDVVVRPPEAKYVHTGRSYYREGIVYQAVTAQPGTIVHELGHLIEDASPALHAAALAFYDRRTAGESLKSLRVLTGLNYQPHEKAREDEFFDPYVGKDYNRTGTEIISMGLESMYADPFFLARVDPDFFEFLFKAMRGVFE